VVTLNVRAGKWLAVALTASLAVNLFLGGIYASRWFMHSPGRMAERALGAGGERGMPAFLERMAESLPPGERAKLTAAITKHQSEIASNGAAVREARRQVRDVATAENFDRAAAEKAFGDLRERSMRFQRSLHETLIDAAADLPPSARRQMVEAGRRGGPARE
jgi:uncharacterized membrane protein